MHLKKVAIHGFKSFADRTEIVFEKGITCIVGPNGCGKSNISDAVRWVLGERSAKLLRGSKMEDVIFSGTEFRKPIGMAEVSLTIDNTDNALPIAYEEVVLTRRLYRSGESEYLINKTPCRYKDIQDVILDTGIGSNSYSMIEQGRIDYILNAHEEERRFLIEEAAGISKFKIKKEEAIRKLERTEANLLRLNDIVSEVEKNIRYAERQAKRAEKYREKYDQLKALESRKAFMDIEALDRENEALVAARNLLRDEINLLEGGLADEEVRFKEMDSRVFAMEEISSKIEKAKYDLKLRHSQNEERLRVNRDKKQDLERSTQGLQKDLEVGRVRIAAFEEEIARKKAEIEAVVQEIQGLKSRVDHAERFYDEARESFTAKENAVKELQGLVFQAAHSVTELKNQIHAFEIEVHGENARKNRTEELIERLSREREECLRRVAELGGESGPDLSQGERKLEFEARQTSLAGLETQRRELEDEIIRVNTEIKETESQLTLLSELQEQGAFDDAFPQHVLDESRREGSELWGLVKSFWDILEVRPGYECAIRAAMADWACALIVEDHDKALKVLEFARASKTKEIALLIDSPVDAPLDDHATPDLTGIQGRAAEFVSVQPGYAGLVEEHLRHVMVAEPLNEERLSQWAASANGVRIVTQDGYVLGPGKKIRYFGSLPNVRTLDRKKSQSDLRDKLARASQIIALRREERGVLDAQISVAVQEVERLEKAIVEAEIQYQSFSKLKQSLQARAEELSAEILQGMREIDLIKSEIEESALKKQGLTDELARRVEAENNHQARLKAEAEELSALAQQKEQFFKTFTEEEQRLARLLDRERYLADSNEMLHRNVSSENELQDKRSSQIADNVRVSEEIVLENERRAAEIAELSSLIAAEEAKAAQASLEKSELVSRRAELLSRLEGAKKRSDTARESERNCQMREMEIGYKKTAIQERMKQTYQIDLSALDKTGFDLQNNSVSELEQEISELKEKLQSLGTVNLLAIEEFDSLKERFDFLSGQKLDLEKGREDLLEAIRKINRETKKLFEDTFSAVQAAFRDYFRVLFGGGEAELFLIDENNPLESGIDIMVRPPGKKNQSISLLSGGEKALTATALLFALFKIKPSPFCVLDEVDAPLDESNVHRFLEVVRGFLSTSQFIIVTHNRKTIAAGDSLYGVTMEEAGVSKIVSVKLNDSAPAGEPIANKEPETNVLLN
ncbi:MAG: chromosome segregation protein SMC [Candidatus Omnitrophica bacterium]|nr:chromosome segregation protein SMC [Candidatus Omnitrophota bacterium]